MQPLTCPIPENINPLQSNGFVFNIQKLPDLSFFCQEANIPELMLPLTEAASPLVNARLPGDKPLYGDLSVTFMVDEQMNNYVAIHNWLVGMGFPEDWIQYTEYLDNRKNEAVISDMAALFSDATLSILNSTNNVVRTIRFVDVFPTSLTSLVMTSTNSDTQYLAGTATFGYTYYKFE